MGFVVPQLQRVLLVDGAVDVELNGLRIAHSDWHCGQVQVCDYQSTAWTAVAAVEVVRSQQVRFDFVELVHHGFYAFWYQRSFMCSASPGWFSFSVPLPLAWSY